MLHKDYLMRMIMEMITGIRRIWSIPERDRIDPTGDIEQTVGDAVNIDPALFFSLEPESAVQMLDMGEVDDSVADYVVHAIFLEATMLEAEGQMAKARLRREQAAAIARYFGCELPDSAASAESLVQIFLEDPEARLDAKNAAEEGAVGETSEQLAAEAKRRMSSLGISADKLKF